MSFALVNGKSIAIQNVIDATVRFINSVEYEPNIKTNENRYFCVRVRSKASNRSKLWADCRIWKLIASQPNLTKAHLIPASFYFIVAHGTECGPFCLKLISQFIPFHISHIMYHTLHHRSINDVRKIRTHSDDYYRFQYIYF